MRLWPRVLIACGEMRVVERTYEGERCEMRVVKCAL